jgi:hypothetical protein
MMMGDRDVFKDAEARTQLAYAGCKDIMAFLQKEMLQP